MKINDTNPIATIFDNHQKSSPSKQTFQEVSTQDQDGTRAIAMARHEEIVRQREKSYRLSSSELSRTNNKRVGCPIQ